MRRVLSCCLLVFPPALGVVVYCWVCRRLRLFFFVWIWMITTNSAFVFCFCSCLSSHSLCAYVVVYPTGPHPSLLPGRTGRGEGAPAVSPPESRRATNVNVFGRSVVYTSKYMVLRANTISTPRPPETLSPNSPQAR